MSFLYREISGFFCCCFFTLTTDPETDFFPIFYYLLLITDKSCKDVKAASCALCSNKLKNQILLFSVSKFL